MNIGACISVFFFFICEIFTVIMNTFFMYTPISLPGRAVRKPYF